MGYPKMLYRARSPFNDQKALEAGLVSGDLQTRIVQSADEQASMEGDGWIEDFASLIGKRRGRPPKAETQDVPSAEGEAT